MGKTTIAWTDFSYNAWIGCAKVGTGCIGCFAEAWDKRFDGGIHWGPGAPRRRTKDALRKDTRQQPDKWNENAFKAGRVDRVFAHSLSDVFDNEVPQEWREDEFRIWRRTPHLRWIVLTKRPGNIQKMLPKNWSPQTYPNVGFCCSVSTQKEFNCEIPKLLQVRASWLGVSIEPQVELIRLPHGNSRWAKSLDWIITGGASAQPGYDTPAYNADWARSLISQCVHAGIACFVKQVGSNPFDGDQQIAITSRNGDDPSEWPPDIFVREFPDQLLR